MGEGLLPDLTAKDAEFANFKFSPTFGLISLRPLRVSLRSLRLEAEYYKNQYG